MTRHALIVVALAASTLTIAAQPSTQVFRAGIDLLTLEVSVSDGDSRPIPDLGEGDFEVQVDGQSRRVVSARFIETNREQPPALDGVIPAHISNQAAVPGRIVAFVVDRDAIASGSERAVLDAAGSMIDALGATDAAGAVALPDASIELTRDKARVRAALTRMTGTRPKTTLSARDLLLSWDEALAYEQNNSRMIGEVIERECQPIKRPPGLAQHCPDDLKFLSMEMLQTGRLQMQQTIAGLRALLNRLAPLRGTKHIVLLSGGLPFGQDLLTHYDAFVRDAAEAEVIVHAIHLEAFEADAANRRITTSVFGSRDFMTGLGTLASMTGGAFYTTAGTGAGIFDRITRAMSGYYLLGVETAPADATAGSRPIDVRVRRDGAVVRYGRRVMPRAGLAVSPSGDRLPALLQQPTDIADLPFAVATYTTRGDEASTFRVLIAGDAANARSAVEWGFTVLNEGNVISTGRQRIEPAAGGAAGTLSSKLLPGRYRLRVAAIDSEGRAAVMELPLAVGMRSAGPLQFSDLILGAAGADGRLQARPSFVQGETVSGLIEILSADPAVLERTRAVFEVAAPGAREPLKRYLMAARPGTAATLANHQMALLTESLPPGIYIASVVPHVGEEAIGRVSRRFEILNR